MGVFVIAEAGVNHNGNIEIAKKLVDIAVEARVDAIKFQTFKSEKVVCANASKAEYQLETTDKKESQLEMLKKLELTKEMHEQLINYCKTKNIMFLSTPFDDESLDLLMEYDLEIIKISSGEITNYPFLKKVAQKRKKVILSTGMSTLDEVKEAVQVLKDNGTIDITLLHCNTQYPTPYKDVNLKAMNMLRNELGCQVGYSDHTEGIEVPIAAVALGATVIEKHFTLDKTMEGPDHKASLEPEELKQMVKAIRNIEQALGNGEKEPSESEKKNIEIVRKSIVAKCDIAEGEVFTEENLTTKRPGNGLTPMVWNDVIGKRAQKDFKEDEQIKL